MPESQWPRSPAGNPASDLAPFFERVDYPYYLLTVRTPDEEMSGCLAGFVTQCSIDPPNFVACISRLNHTLGVAVRSPAMGLHLLGEDQLDMARLFGEETGDEIDKFPGPTGASGPPERRCSPMSCWRSRERSSATSRLVTTRPFSSEQSAPWPARVVGCSLIAPAHGCIPAIPPPCEPGQRESRQRPLREVPAHGAALAETDG